MPPAFAVRMGVGRVRQPQEFTRRGYVLLPGYHLDVVDGGISSVPLWCWTTSLKPNSRTPRTFSALAKESLNDKAVRRRVDAGGRHLEVGRIHVLSGHDWRLVLQAERRHVGDGLGEREGHGLLQLYLGGYQIGAMDGGSQALEYASTLDRNGDDHGSEDMWIDIPDVVGALRERTALDLRQQAPNLLQLHHQVAPVLNIAS